MKIFISSIFLFLAVTSQVLYSQLNGPEYLCGTDDRVPFNHLAVGRIITEPNGKVSTGWILFDGRIVTASHVFDLATEGSFIEFNVPESNGCGSWGHPPAEHKYYIDMNSIVRSNPHPVGNDWAIFSVEPNRTTGLLPKDAQNAFFYVEQSSNSSTLELIGFGEDDESSRCYASQKSIGNYSGLSGSIIKHTCDTRWGNSGSPIINTTTGKVIGIHTTGTCDKLSYNQGTSTYNTGFWSAVYSDYNFVIHQKRNSGTELTGSKINRWIGSYASGNFQEYTVGTGGAFIEDVVFGSYETFRSFQEITEDAPYEKYNNWEGFTDVSNYRNFLIQYPTNILTSKFKQTYTNTTFDNVFIELPGPNPSSDVIEFKDPWLIDYDDPVYFGTDKRNQGMNAPFKLHTAPFRPDYTTSYNGDVYQGVFLNQLIVSDKPYYSVKATPGQDITLFNTGFPSGRLHKFYLYSWDASPINSADFKYSNSAETPLVLHQDNATILANLKGTQISANINAYTSSSQRKFAEDSQGHLHSVYESLGDVWYEKSTNNGTTWEIMNGGKPVNAFWETSNAKSPAISISTDGLDFIYITYQSSRDLYGSEIPTVLLAHIYPDTVYWQNTVYPFNGASYSDNFQPALVAFNGGAVVIFNPPQWTGWGLHGIKKNVNSSHSPTSSTEYYIPNSDINSTSPSIAQGGGRFHLAFVHQGYQVRYLSWNIDDNPISSNIYSIVSQGSGYYNNIIPSISVTATAYPIISWVGKLYGTMNKAILRRGQISGSTISWDSFYQVGTNVQNAHNNSSRNYPEEQTVLVWNEGTTNTVSKWIKKIGISPNFIYSTPSTLSHSGSEVQVATYSSLSSFRAMVFNNLNFPYYFTKSSTDFFYGGSNNILSKITDTDTIVTFGRSGVSVINDIEFAFEIGDILVGDSIINFIQVPDTIVYTSSSELNQHTRTENFTLTPETQFYFTNIYYVVQKANPDSALTNTDAVNFKAELVNAFTDQIVGTFDNVTYNKNNLLKHNNIDYSVDCSGITPGEYYLRLVSTVTGEAEYVMANIVNDNTTLAKKNFNTVSFKGTELPETYALEQNFPNPFNPTTTIRYQIPKDGLVTLKIYDILGAEVATLVNEEKVAGRYEVNFNAGKLASGVYIYTIKSNDFTASKKLMLLK